MRIWNAIRHDSKCPIKSLLPTAMAFSIGSFCSHGERCLRTDVQWWRVLLARLLWNTIAIRDILPGIPSTNRSVAPSHILIQTKRTFRTKSTLFGALFDGRQGLTEDVNRVGFQQQYWQSHIFFNSLHSPRPDAFTMFYQFNCLPAEFSGWTWHRSEWQRSSANSSCAVNGTRIKYLE